MLLLTCSRAEKLSQVVALAFQHRTKTELSNPIQSHISLPTLSDSICFVSSLMRQDEWIRQCWDGARSTASQPQGIILDGNVNQHAFECSCREPQKEVGVTMFGPLLPANCLRSSSSHFLRRSELRGYVLIPRRTHSWFSLSNQRFRILKKIGPRTAKDQQGNLEPGAFF